MIELETRHERGRRIAHLRVAFYPDQRPDRCAKMRLYHHVASISLMLALLFPGCMPVPPFTTPVSPKVTGRVLDASSKTPIKGALARTERAGYVRQSYTSEDGQFLVPSASQWHYLVYLGSPGFFPTPWMFKNGKLDLVLTIEAAGYSSKSKVFHSKDIGWDVELPDCLEIALDPQ